MDASKKKKIIALVVVILLSLCIVFSMSSSGENASEIIVKSTQDPHTPAKDIVQEESASDVAEEYQELSVETVKIIPVYICGAVEFPDVYQIDAGEYLYELIDQAGGLSDSAATEYINLVLQINESMSIYIPTYKEIENNVDAFNDPAGVLIRDSSNTWSWGNQEATSITEISAQTSGLVNINTASASELTTLPGIGDVTAQAIITHRENQGSFNKIEDIMNVAGIKDSRFNAIRDQITVN